MNRPDEEEAMAPDRDLDRWADIALVQTPFFFPTMPPPWMGALQAHLSRHRLEASLHDLNIDTFLRLPLETRQSWRSHCLVRLQNHHGEAALPPASFETELARQVRYLKCLPAMALGFHAAHATLPWLHPLLKQLREAGDRRPFILGGPGTWVRAEWPDAPWDLVDYLVVGEGEETLEHLLRCLQEGRPTGLVPGLVRAPGRPDRYRPRPPMPRLDNLSRPTFDGLPISDYEHACLPVSGSRGCAFRCAYCSDQPYWGEKRIRPVAEVLNEIEWQCSKHPWERALFTDLLLGQQDGWLETLAEQWRQRRLKLAWRATLHPSSLRSQDRAESIAQAGCSDVEFSLVPGDGDPDISIGNGEDLDLLEAAVRSAHDAGIRIHLDIIVGVPGMREENLRAAEAWLTKHRDLIHRVSGIGACRVLPQSRLEKKPARFGIVLPPANHHSDWQQPGGGGPELRLVQRDRLIQVCEREGIPLSRETSKNLASDKANVNDQQRALRRAGFRQGRPLSGPEFLEIELTNQCNLDCVGCWCHSPLLGDERMSKETRRRKMPTEAALRLIDHAAELGVEHIQISGAGEPTLHPDFDRIVRRIKERGLRTTLVTNFTLVDEGMADRLIELQVDDVTASIWAGTPSDYVAVHPAQKPERFNHIVRTLEYLQERKRHVQSPFPRVKLYHVICHDNAHGLVAAAELARTTGCQGVEFTPIAIESTRLDSLALSSEDAGVLEASLGKLSSNLRYPFDLGTGHLDCLDSQQLSAELTELGRMMHHPPPGFTLGDDLRSVRCVQGRQGHVRYVDENLFNRIEYEFPQHNCEDCPKSTDCSVPASGHTLHVGFASVRGAGSFLRRVGGAADAAPFDASILEQVPCSVGWSYARVRVDGALIPCCKAVKLPMGNVFELGLREVWFGEPMERFRRKSRKWSEESGYFAAVGCRQGCDNLGMNLHFLRDLEDDAATLDARICSLLNSGEGTDDGEPA